MRYSDEDLWSAVQHVARSLNRVPTRSEFMAMTGIHPMTITRRLGPWFETFHKALESGAFEERARAAIERVRKLTGGATPGRLLYEVYRDKETDPPRHIIEHYFGGWSEALEKLGFPPPRPGGRGHDHERILRALAELWDELGHPPTSTEIREHMRDHPDLADPSTYSRRFGSMDAARKAASAYRKPRRSRSRRKR